MSDFPSIPIKPHSWSLTASNLRVYIVDYQLNKSARIVAQLLDDTKMLDKQVLLLEGQDFARWGDDDNYIIDWVCKKYGLVIDTSRPRPPAPISE
jgi:hypothetical protein